MDKNGLETKQRKRRLIDPSSDGSLRTELSQIITTSFGFSAQLITYSAVRREAGRRWSALGDPETLRMKRRHRGPL